MHGYSPESAAAKLRGLKSLWLSVWCSISFFVPADDSGLVSPMIKEVSPSFIAFFSRPVMVQAVIKSLTNASCKICPLTNYEITLHAAIHLELIFNHIVENYKQKKISIAYPGVPQK